MVRKLTKCSKRSLSWQRAWMRLKDFDRENEADREALRRNAESLPLERLDVEPEEVDRTLLVAEVRPLDVSGIVVKRGVPVSS